MTELSERLNVHTETDAGWDERTEPNETADARGHPRPRERGFAPADPFAPGARAYDHPEVVALRARLRERNGLVGLEICEPEEVDRIVRIFRRDGFVVVRDLLDQDALARWRAGCTRVLADILATPGQDGRRYQTETQRLAHRYSFGTCSASRQLLHEPEWAAMVALDTSTPILDAIFGFGDYRVLGAGGDLCLPGAIEYQHLHADVLESGSITPERLAQATRTGVAVPASVKALDFNTARLVIERTPPMVTINFLMTETTWENGPIRQIPGTHARAGRPPPPRYEPTWMKTSTLVGAPAGAGIFRDNRAWHGGTPNLGRGIRAMPNVEYVPLWNSDRLDRTMPYEIWQSLSNRGRDLCQDVVSEPGVWPPGAGFNHPLADERRRAQARMQIEQRRPGAERARPK